MYQKRLHLNKSTIANLSFGDLDLIRGGRLQTCEDICDQDTNPLPQPSTHCGGTDQSNGPWTCGQG